jgi:protein RecA
MPAPKDREKALEAALSQIDRQFGKGSIMRLGDDGRAPVEVIPTGSIALDVALGIGGLPRGRVVEIYGPESSGKTTLALHAVANAQKAGGIAAFIDAEHALDPEYAKKLGVDTDALLVSQPDTGEQALEIMDMLIRSGAIDIVVVDSVAALVPKAEIEGEMGDSHVGLQARLMSQALRKITGALNSSGTTAIFINQLRENVRLARDHHGWQGAQVLRICAPGHPPHRDAQGGYGGRRQPDPREGRQEQDGAALQAGGVRHPLRGRHLPRGQPHRHGRGARLRAQVRRLVHVRG